MMAVILAAGYGSRLLPFTSFRPKHMLPVAGKYVLERAIEYIRDVLNINEIVIVVGYLRDAVIDYFGTGDKHGVNIKYVIQHTYNKRGLAAALELVKDLITSDFVLYLADNLFEANLKQVVEKHLSEGNHATIHVERNDEPQRFGVVVTNEEGRIIKIIEKPENPPTNLVISGFYVLSPIIFKYLNRIMPSKRGEYELSDALQLMIEDNARVYASFIEGWRQDIGRPEDLLKANKKLLSSGHHKNEGRIIDSEIISPVFIHKEVIIKNSKIGPFVMIEKGCTIFNSEITDTVILENTNIEKSNLRNTIIGANSKIKNVHGTDIVLGDFTRLEIS